MRKRHRIKRKRENSTKVLTQSKFISKQNRSTPLDLDQFSMQLRDGRVLQHDDKTLNIRYDKAVLQTKKDQPLCQSSWWKHPEVDYLIYNQEHHEPPIKPPDPLQSASTSESTAEANMVNPEALVAQILQPPTHTRYKSRRQQQKNMNFKKCKRRQSNQSKYTNFVIRFIRQFREKLKDEPFWSQPREENLKKKVLFNYITTEKQLFFHLLDLKSNRAVWRTYYKKMKDFLQTCKDSYQSDSRLQQKCRKIEQDLQNINKEDGLEKAFCDRFEKKATRQLSLYKTRLRKSAPKIKKIKK